MADGPRGSDLDVEALQEQLTTSRRALGEERARRHDAEHLARGLVELSTASTPEQLAKLVVGITTNILRCDAVILSGRGDDALRARESTHEALEQLTWPRDTFVERVMTGRPVIVARADRHPGWRAHAQTQRAVVGSALHARIFDDPDEGAVMLVAVHGGRGYFGREHSRRIELIRAPLEQAWRRSLAIEREARLRHDAEVAYERLRETQDELLAARDAAERASSAKSTFLAQMSHELRTPLAGIIGLTRLVLDGEIPEEPRSLIGTARDCAQHLLQVLNDILDLSKIEAGKLELESIALDVEALARQVLDLVRVRAGEKGLELQLTVELQGGAANRLGDPLRLKQVLFNLLSNAIKFTDRGQVALRVDSTEADTLRFEVRDTGVGIAPHKLRTIFEAFRQADNSTTRRYGGSGLGLTISRRLVELFGGEIWAESEPSVGSCFAFTAPLPRSHTSSDHAALKPDPPLNRHSERTLRVLIAEDNAVNQLVARKMLERRGHQVVVVSDGEQAVEAVRQQPASEPFDVVLMDIQMPRLDGFAATARIRELGLTDLPVIALTANAMTGERERCIARGMDDYLTKPLDEVALDEALEALLAASTTRRGDDASSVSSVAQTR